MNQQTKRKKILCYSCSFLVPGVPRELTLSLSPSNPPEEIVVDWRSPAGGDAITRYYLQWELSSKGKYINHISLQYNYTDTINNLNPATTYNVRVAAINSAGWGSYTAFETITTGTKTFQWCCCSKLKKNCLAR